MTTMLEGLGTVEIAVAACIVFGAFIIRGMSGFGAGMLGIPLLAFMMPVHTAVSMFGLLVLVLFAFLSVRDWGEVVHEELKLLFVPTLVGVVCGVPQPVVARTTLMNVPETGLYNWDPGAFFGIYHPDTFWFK